MPVGTPDWLVAEGGGTPDVTVTEGDLLTDAEHTVIDHSGIPGVPTITAVALVDNSGGTADGTIETLADVSSPSLLSNAAQQDHVNARLATINSNFADLAAKVNQIITDLT